MSALKGRCGFYLILLCISLAMVSSNKDPSSSDVLVLNNTAVTNGPPDANSSESSDDTSTADHEGTSVLAIASMAVVSLTAFTCTVLNVGGIVEAAVVKKSRMKALDLLRIHLYAADIGTAVLCVILQLDYHEFTSFNLVLLSFMTVTAACPTAGLIVTTLMTWCRYWSISDPYRNGVRRSTVVIVIVLAWILPLSVHITFACIMHSHLERMATDSALKDKFLVSIVICDSILYIVPPLVNFFVYLTSFVKLRQQARVFGNGDVSGNREASNRSAMLKLFLSGMANFLLVLPVFIDSVAFKRSTSPDLHSYYLWSTYVNTACLAVLCNANPLLYSGWSSIRQILCAIARSFTAWVIAAFSHQSILKNRHDTDSELLPVVRLTGNRNTESELLASNPDHVQIYPYKNETRAV